MWHSAHHPTRRSCCQAKNHAISRQLGVDLSLRRRLLPSHIEAEKEADDLPYLLIQRQFEDADDDLCHVETHDEKYTGHFLLRRVEFTSQRFSIELNRRKDNLVSVTFTMAPSDFEEASRVVKVIVGQIEPQ
jgi:hypothetical protein